MADPDTPADDLEVAELRGRLRGRWKAERREHEREALHEHWAQRTLLDAVRESMDRGDHIAIHLPGPRTLTGHIVGVGQDYAFLRSTSTPVREYAVRLSAPAAANPYGGPLLYVEILANHANSAPPAPDDLPPTFQAVLQQHAFHHQQDPQLTAEIGAHLHPRGLAATIMAHAGDHLYVHEPQGRDLLLPVACITYVARPSTQFRSFT